MKLTTILSTTALAVLLGISIPVFAQDDSHPQEEKRAEPDAKQDKQEDKQVDKDKQIDKEKADKQEDKDKHEQEDKSITHQDAKQDQRADAKQGGRIPEDRFRANFGRAHTFSIGHPVIVAGTPRFQYGGYWFVIANRGQSVGPTRTWSTSISSTADITCLAQCIPGYRFRSM